MSIDVVYDWSQFHKLGLNLRDLAKQVPSVLEGAVDEVGLFIEREAQVDLTEKGGVDTGRLRASIGHGPDGIYEIKKGFGGVYVTVGTNVEYAPYVEYGFTMGTGHVVYFEGTGFRFVQPFTFAGYHYMEAAAQSAKAVIGRIVERHIQVAIEKGLIRGL